MQLDTEWANYVHDPRKDPGCKNMVNLPKGKKKKSSGTLRWEWAVAWNLHKLKQLLNSIRNVGDKKSCEIKWQSDSKENVG